MTDEANGRSNGNRNRRILREASGGPPPNAQPNVEPAAEEEAPVVRLRNGGTVVNGEQKSDPNAAIQRGMEVLAEQELDQNLEEIKKLDTQLDHFNQYLDTFEKKNNELTERLTNMIKTQREDRLKRRQSFVQREEEYKAEQNSFENQINRMLSKCAQSRRTSVPVFGADVERMIEQNKGDKTDDSQGRRMDTSK